MSGNFSNEDKMGSEIPKLNPIIQSEYFRNQTVTQVEWMDSNEYYLSDLWYAMNTYISDSNRHVLDKCTYPMFCEFVAKNTTLTSESRDDIN